VQPNPIRFVQLNNDFWMDLGPLEPYWMNLDFHAPEGCVLQNTTELCPEGTLEPKVGVHYCLVCEDPDAEYTISDWLFTAKPHVFGLIGGWANPTGIALIIILTVMVICSMPFVRRGGYFEVNRIACLPKNGSQIKLCATRNRTRNSTCRQRRPVING
jgi:hypothetical protein